MIVVAGASPRHYLVLIQETEILPALYGQVLTLPAVFNELTRYGTPEAVRRWVSKPPDWLQVRAPTGALVASASLGRGEQEAIALAEELSADVLLVDDWAARREAERRHLPVQGTLGLLGLAAVHGLTDLPAAIARLRQTNFRASEEIIQRILEQDADRTRP